MGRGVELRGFTAVVGEAAGEALLRAGAGKLLMFSERFRKSCLVNGAAAFRRHFLREFRWETVRVVQMEGGEAVEDIARSAVQSLLKMFQSLLERRPELTLFAAQRIADGFPVFLQVSVRVPVRRDDFFGDGCGERPFRFDADLSR